MRRVHPDAITSVPGLAFSYSVRDVAACLLFTAIEQQLILKHMWAILSKQVKEPPKDVRNGDWCLHLWYSIINDWHPQLLTTSVGVLNHLPQLENSLHQGATVFWWQGRFSFPQVSFHVAVERVTLSAHSHFLEAQAVLGAAYTWSFLGKNPCNLVEIKGTWNTIFLSRIDKMG